MVDLLITASLSSFLFGLFGVSWEAVDEKIARQYPTVAYISTDELVALQASSPESSLALFDVRETAEFAVSHLEGAQNLTTAAAIANAVPDKSTPIIVYCSVGYRSAAVASQLQELGFNNAVNLKHSIFEWVEKGYPLQNDRGPISKVHPYNKAWGALIDKSYHYVPD